MIIINLILIITDSLIKITLFKMLLKLGSRGKRVEEIQRALGLTPDGIYGKYTEGAVKKYQKLNGLTPDGIVGPLTFNHIVEHINLDTDRFGYDDSSDFDDKLEYLGEYETSSGLCIDRAYLDTDQYVRDYGKVKPSLVFIHHTAGWDNPYNTIRSWNTDSRGRVATQYCIGGSNIKTGDSTYDGKVVQCFPDNYIGWHLGKIGDFSISKESVAIELNNFGYVNRVGDKFYNYVDREVPEHMVCDLGYKFRGHQYWHKYTDAQIESLRLLLLHIKDIYQVDIRSGIPSLLFSGENPKDVFEFNSSLYNGNIKSGTWTHCNVRKDKFDCFPQPELVDMLKTL
jgi:N-acetyl-anhydromuramyl-L-alanine amidase AmpD